MISEGLHPRAEEFLRRLRRAGAQLPPERLRELMAEIEVHISEAIPPGASDRQVDDALERLGSPSDIVEAERPPGQRSEDRRSWRERAAVILLPLGGFAVGVGWLFGLVLLWRSRLWTTREKLIGTLVVPGGIATTILVAVLLATKRKCKTFTQQGPTGTLIRAHCTPSAGAAPFTTAWHIALVLFCIFGPIVTAIYLARRSRKRSTFTGHPVSA